MSLVKLGNVYRIPRRAGSLDGFADILAINEKSAMDALESYIAENASFDIKITGDAELLVLDVWG